MTLPARHFNWRIRGNALTWALGDDARLAQEYDLVVATSMTDLATLRGLVPTLARARTLVYFHENQFAYPVRAGAPLHMEPRMVGIYTALAADEVIFNSTYNRETFLEGTDSLLARMPDGVPGGVIDRLRTRSRVIPVPLEDAFFAPRQRNSTEPFTILWNHRWEYDKAPERFLAALRLLSAQNVDFRLNIVGQRFRNVPPAFEKIRDEFDQRIVNWGFLEERDYLGVLDRSHVVVSTALHDFQGLAVLEATARGCVPLVPDRLAYPEFVPPGFRYPGDTFDPDSEAQSLASRLVELAADHLRGRLPPAPELRHLSWNRLLGQYAEAMELPHPRQPARTTTTG